jgi:N6-adenosine-specific RNA methylase IME4
MCARPCSSRSCWPSASGRSVPSCSARSEPDKKYGVIYADPEWRFEVYSRDTGMDRAADNHYPTIGPMRSARGPVGDIAADDCVLFLWATVPMLPDALRVMAAWGFEYKSHAIWKKDRIGTGYWFRNQHELLLVGTRGNIPAPAMGTQFESVIDAPVGKHSAKPGTPRKGGLSKLAHQLRRPASWVSSRARQLGCVAPRFRDPPWSDAEIDLLRRHAAKIPNTIARILRQSGYKRTAGAVSNKLVKLRCERIDENHYSATALAGLFGVNQHAVSSWIKKGLLIAKTKGTTREHDIFTFTSGMCGGSSSRTPARSIFGASRSTGSLICWRTTRCGASAKAQAPRRSAGMMSAIAAFAGSTASSGRARKSRMTCLCPRLIQSRQHHPEKSLGDWLRSSISQRTDTNGARPRIVSAAAGPASILVGVCKSA